MDGNILTSCGRLGASGHVIFDIPAALPSAGRIDYNSFDDDDWRQNRLYGFHSRLRSCLNTAKLVCTDMKLNSLSRSVCKLNHRI
jgi:hypothetical protein